MAKIKIAKQHWGYIIPTLLLIAGGLFLFMKTDGSTGGFMSGGFKSYGYFSGGSGGKDLNVKSVRWHTHNGYERLVFDISKWDGVLGNYPYKSTNETGTYEIGTELQNARYIDGELSGFRSFSGNMPYFKKSKILEKMQVFPNGDDSYLSRINLKRTASYKVFTLKNPARIIIDIK
jgi:hypothetical protein